MPGLKLKVRNGIYRAEGTFEGRRIRESLGTRDKKEAQEKLAIYQAKLFKSAVYGQEAVRTFEDAALHYQEHGGEGRFLVKIIHYFRGRLVSSIKPGELREMAIKLYPAASAATRNRQAIVPARAVIKHAHDLGWCPAISVKMFEVRKSNKHKPVDDAWLSAFLSQADKDGLQHLSALVLFMNQTGARVSEAVNLTGEYVDLGQRLALLAETKTEQNSVRGLTAELVTRIAGLGLWEGEPVFRYTDPKAVNRRIAAVCKRAGIETRTTHSAGRHSFGTNGMAISGDIKKVMEAGGWKSAKLFMETYVHTSEAGRSLAEQFDRQNTRIGMVSERSKTNKRYRFGKKD